MIGRLINTFRDAISDYNRDFSERIFLWFTLISEIVVFIALIGDFFTGENRGEIITLIATLIFVPVLSFVCLHVNKLNVACVVIVLGLIFVILPALFLFGGGIRGGGIIWVIFAFLYTGSVVSGKLRVFSFCSLSVLTIAGYWLDYNHPRYIAQHTKDVFYIDSCISIVLVGIIVFMMSSVQKALFIDENRRAREAAQKAEELTKAQNRFFSSMSHEIRTPINSILGLNELILRDTSASEEVVKDASGIQGAGKMLLALINDILDFSKMEAGSMDIVPVDYKIGDTLSEIVNMIWLRAHDKGLEFNVSVDPKVPTTLYGDEVRIKQIIINILNNAVKYTKSGSVELHIECENIEKDSAELSISVSDTGMGIKKEALPYLFDAFKRVDQEKNRMIEGTGLGLSIVKQIVELMGGTINVNSVYGEGSTFTINIKQGISDRTEIGELNLHNQKAVRVNEYESSFRAPEGAVLIVDDNEMNLEVESKLLVDTEMVIDKALSGKIALDMTTTRHYDVILMDHLMPEMDGIECYEKIRKQSGGLNRNTPIVILTANAGSENIDMYKRAGFDGYLVKPVSGESLEKTLIKYIPSEKVILSEKMMSMHEDINAAAAYKSKVPVMVTTTSMCDLPHNIIIDNNLSILPFEVHTDEGVFKDGVQMDASDLVRYIESGGNAVSSPPDEEVYTEFFAENLKKAHYLIHIALTTSMSLDFRIASEAAKSFDNVIVINSECLSSATGILVMIANKLVQQNLSVEEIVQELQSVKKRLKCSFVIDKTKYMAQRGLVSDRVHKMAEALELHPCLTVKNDRSTIGGIWMGNKKRAYNSYIKKAFPVDVIPDSDVVFITYVDVPMKTLLWIKDEIRKYAYFEHVVFKQASAAISANCGPGTFGILYFVKSNKSYNLGSYFSEDIIDDYEEPEDDEILEDEIDETAAFDEYSYSEPEIVSESEAEKPWYYSIPNIDADIAITNSGSEDAFKTVLEIFYDSIDEKYKELDGYYTSEDWENYTIKVHALKSSAKLIGAMELSEEAQRLENAGKEKNIDYISEHHTPFMEEYLNFNDVLSEIFSKDGAEGAEDAKPVADEFLIESVYEGLLSAAEAMNLDEVEEILNELKDYAIPDSEKDKFDAIYKSVDNFDYDGIIAALKS